MPWRWPRRQGWHHPVRDVRSRVPKGVLTFWARARRLLWSWWPWALVSMWAIGDTRWGWAVGAGAMAIVSYLIAPAAAPPRFGLDHEFSIESGTTNFDNRSFAHNEESNVCVFDGSLATQLHQIFQDDLEGCERLTIDQWTQRGVWARAQEFVASFLRRP